MAKKYWWEDENQQDNAQKSETKSHWWEDNSVSSTVGENITNRVNTWLKNHNTYISNYQTRNSGRKYNYEDSYVSDSADWLNTVSQQKSAFDAEADSILSYMDQYKDYLNADWMAQVRKTLTDARGAQDIVLGNTRKDNEWWSSFKDENGYKAAQRYDGYSKKYSGQKYEDIQKALGILEDGEERDWLANNQDKLYKGDSTYNSKAASGMKSYEAQKIADQKAKEQEEANKSWWDKAADFIIDNDIFGPSTDNPILDLIEDQREIYAEDTSWREPNDEWSEEQKKHFGVLWTEDPTKAYKYAVQVNNQINATKKYATQQHLGANASENIGTGALSTLAAIATAPTGFADLMDDLIEYSARGTITQKEHLTPFEYSQTAISANANKLNEAGTLNENIPIFGGKGWGDIYSLGVSTANSMLSALTLGGAGTLVNFIGQGGASGVDDALSRGASAEQALMYGTAVGALEGLTEMIPAEKLIKIGASASAKNWLKQALKQGVGEFFEEGASSFFGNLADDLIMKDKSNYNLKVKELMQQNPGMTEEEASGIAFKQMARDVAFDAVGGFMSGTASGGITGGVSTALDARKGNQANIDAVKQYGEHTDALIQKGLQNDKKSESYQLAQKYQKQTQGKDGKGGKAMSGFQIRNLLAANQAEVTKADLVKIQDAAANRLAQVGQREDIYKIAELATKYATGQEMTRAERSTLARSNFGSQVASEMLNGIHPDKLLSNWENNMSEESGAEYSTDWTGEIGTESDQFIRYNNKKLARAIFEHLANSVVEDPAPYKSLESRVEAEEPAQVSDTGKSVIRGTDQEIDLTKPTFKEITKEGAVLDVDGEPVSANNIDYADEDIGYAIRSVGKIENITPEAAGAVVSLVDMSKPVVAQMNGMDEAFSYGFNNYSQEDLKAGLFTKNLTEAQLNDAYKLGQYVRGKSVVDADAPVVKMRTAADAKLTAEQKTAQQKARIESKDVEVYFKDGGTVVKFDEHTGKYDPKRMAAVNTAKFLSKLKIGGKYYFFESYLSKTLKDEEGNALRVYKDADGNEVKAPNGMYKDADGSIQIDLNAGNAGQGTALFTLGHELTHFVKGQSKEQFKVLGDLVKEAFDKTDLSMNDRVLAKQKFLEDIRGKAVSYTEAYEEVVADAMSTMLTDGTFHEKLMEIKVKDKGLFKTIKRFFEKMIAKFRDAYAKLDPDQQDARDIRELKDMFDKIQTAFAEALVEASENFQASITASESQTLTEAGIGFDEETKSAYSLRYSTAYKDTIQVGKKSFDTETIAQIVAKGTGRSIEDARKWVKSEMAIANIVMQNPEFLDFEADNRYEAIKKNSDYPQGTVDLSNLCPKREEFTAMFDKLQKEYPNKLFTAQDIADMRKILAKNDITVACGACFVEDRRQLIGEIADTFIGMWKEAAETGKPLQKTNAAGQKADLLVTKALAKQYGLTAGTKIMATDTYIPNQYDLTTYEGFKLLEKNHPTIAMAFNRYNNSRGQQSARLIEGRAEYNRQILGWSDAKARSVNNNGGLRIFSFSDFEVVHLLDLVQVIIDCSARGVKIQGYTKIPAFAKLVRDTGIKLNRSLIPKGDYGYHMENGKVVLDYDTTEGIDIHDENFLDESDNPNVGNIVIGINPTQIGAAMLDSFVDYIIPFHSNKAKEILKKLGTGAWVNYKESQHEKDISTGKASKHNVNIYTEVINKYHPKNKVEFVDAFLKECKRQGKTPRYAEFLNVDANGDYAYREGYHKLLVDFKMFDKDGNILPQGNITPTLNEGFMRDLLNAEVDKKQNYKFPQEVYDDINKKFGENSLDISSVHGENELTNDKTRGEVNYDNRRIREVSSENAGSAEDSWAKAADGRRNTGHVGETQKAVEWRDIDPSVRKAVKKAVKSHINSSANFNELYDYIVSLTGKSESDLTPYSYNKAVNNLTESVYTDAINLHPVLFENKWAIFGDGVSKLRSDILGATHEDSANSTKGVKHSDRDSTDIRYSERGEGTSNRHLLANAFEGITKSSIEYKMIQEYKDMVGTLNRLDNDLADINAEIRKIRFGTEGARDMDKLRSLEEKAQRIANGINRYDKRLLNMEASEPLRKVIERERKKEAQKTKDHVKEIQENKKVRAEQTELRHKIRKTIRDLDKILNRGNKKQNVKEDVQNVVTKALQAADILFTDNYGTYDMLRNGIGADLSDSEEALVKACTRMLKDLDKMPTDGYDNFQARQEAENKLKTKMSKLNEVFARERKRLNNTTVSSILGELADAYASLEKSDQSYVQGAYTEAVHNFLKSLQSEVGGTIVKDMTKDQLEYVYAAYKMVLTTVRKANQMFNEELKMSREQLGNAVIQEVMNAGGVHGLWTKAELAVSKADWNNMKPIWVANRIGSETFGKLMHGLFEGQYNFAVDVEEAKQFKLSMDEKYKPRSWDAEKLYEFESSTGKKFSLNLQQIMSLYAFSKREQSYSHLLNGGFVFDGNSTVIVDEKGRKKTYIHNGATSYKLNEATLNEIISSLTEKQKAYVDEMQKYLSEVMGAKGNEVSMQLYGIKMFKEQFYFPLRSSGAYMERAKEAEMKKQQGQINLVNSGFTHAVKPEAKNPIILSGFMDVWAEHCNEMSMYHSMVLPMEDFRKVYNYSTVHDDKFDSASVFQTIQDAYGDAATAYIDQLYRELNAGATIDPRETPFKKLISNFKKTAVMLSASVVVQQFSSVGRAYALIDPKYFIGTRVNSDTQLSVADEMKKYAPVAIIKEMGGFDTGTKGSAKSYIMAEKYGKGEWLQGLKKDEQYRSDLMGILPAKADEKTWCAIWEAVKRETKAKHPKMDVKSEEFLKLAGERFSEVIEKTQVYDSVLARSANMRSKTGLMQMATSFMAEPTTTVNLLEDAIRRGDKKYMARAFGAVAVSIVLNNALASIVYAMRDDDEDETFIEKYFQSFTSGMIDDINPMSYYPFLKDVYSIFQGYDVERADMSVIADLRDALKRAVSLIGKDTSSMDDEKLAEHYKTVNSAILSLLDAGCSVFGVPLKNIRRDANGIINAWNTVGKDLTQRDTSWNSFWDKVGAAAKDTIPIFAWTKDAPKTDKLYNAIVSSDKSYLARLKSTYKTDSAYQSAVRKALRENDSRIHEAAQAGYEGNRDERNRIFQEIKKEGKFAPSEIIDAINSELSAIRNKLEPEKVTSQYDASTFVDAVSLGDTKTAMAMMEDIISSYVANGKTQEEAEKTFEASVLRSIQEAFSVGLLDEARAEEMLVEYAGKDEDEAASNVNYWAFSEAHPEYKLTESNVNDYQEFAEPAGIELDVFVQYINGTKNLATKYDQWGDVEVTVREQVLEVIDSLPLTWQQKDALYLAAGYPESKIWDVPW